MSQVCHTCQHRERHAIDELLVRGVANREIARRYELSEAGVRRHKAKHLPETLLKGQEVSEVARGADLLAEVGKLQQAALGILGKAYQAGNLSAALRAIGEARSCVELTAKMVTIAAGLEQPGQVMTDEELLREAISSLEALGYVVIAP